MIYYKINIKNINSNEKKFLITGFYVFKVKKLSDLCNVLFFFDFWLVFHKDRFH